MSKRKENITQFRDKTIEELKVSIRDLKANLSQRIIESGFGKLKDLRTIRKLRKEIARAVTILNEKLSNKDIIQEKNLSKAK